MPALQSMDYNFKPRETPEDFGWHDRGYLPHFDAGSLPQFITFRLDDSMPQELLDEWRPIAVTDAAFRKRIEAYLDSGHGSCWLRDKRVATMMQDALLFHKGSQYTLHAWVVMPNHVHVLLTPLEDVHLPTITHSIKSYTANEANKIIGQSGQFWQIESFDRYIRNSKHFVSVIRYIENNPVKARLCKSPEEWPFSSASFRK